MLPDTERFHQKTELKQDETDGKESEKESVLSPGAEAGYRAGAELMWKEIREKRVETLSLSTPCFSYSPCSDNKPRFVHGPALLGRIGFINYSVIGKGGTSESDVTLVPKLVLLSQTVLVCLH